VEHSNNDVGVQLNGGATNSAPGYGFGAVDIFGESIFGTENGVTDGSGNWYQFIASGTLPGATMTALRLIAASGNLTSGSASLYSYSS
jgi:hypothetical protein